MHDFIDFFNIFFLATKYAIVPKIKFRISLEVFPHENAFSTNKMLLTSVRKAGR